MATSEEPAPMGDAQSALNVAAWHLQVVIASLTGFDGKIMFLTALNVGGISAMIGVEIAADPALWLLAIGIALSSANAAAGLGSLWTVHLRHFPTPEEALLAARQVGTDSQLQAWRHFAAIQDAVDQAETAMTRQARVMRSLLVSTPVALSFVVLAAMLPGA